MNILISMIKTNQDKIIKKHSSLTQLWGKYTLIERKAMNALIYLAKDTLKKDPTSIVFVCELWTIKRLAWINSNDNGTLKKALRSLKLSSFEYNVLNKDKSERGIFNFLSEVKITSWGRGKKTIVTYQFPFSILEAIQHPNMFVKLNLYVMWTLSSKHSYVLYEIMTDYKNLGTYVFSIQNFRLALWIMDSQYRIFTMLKKRVIETAIEEINLKTDICLWYSLIKNGKKTESIKFSITNRVPKIWHNKWIKEEVKTKLKFFWLSSYKIDTLLQKYDLKYLLANISVVEQNSKRYHIRNHAGYLMKAIEMDYSHSENVVLNDKTQVAEIWKTVKSSNYKQGMVDDLIKWITEENLKSLKIEFLTSIQSNPFFKKLNNENWFEDKVIQYVRYKFLVSKNIESGHES